MRRTATRCLFAALMNVAACFRLCAGLENRESRAGAFFVGQFFRDRADFQAQYRWGLVELLDGKPERVVRDFHERRPNRQTDG